jgi:hypothetical protein
MISLGIQNAHLSRRLAAATPLAGVSAGLWLLYVLIFVGTGQTTPGPAMAAAAANVLPLVVLAAVVLSVVRKMVVNLPSFAQAAAHTVLALTFVFAWYGSAVVLLAMLGALEGQGFHFRGFEGPALAWQLFQGLVLYVAIAAIGYALRRTAQGSLVPPVDIQPLERYLIRAGEDFCPIHVNDIVTITGAQDYSEVVTAAGRHLVRLSLAQFESRLDSNHFIRVHRSTIIHLSHLERIELAGGGRMLAHMRDGQSVRVSRAGVQSLRQLIV